MRTLKKVLALSLVFAMAFTMMAGAAFKDQNKIDSALTNNIQLLTALGVFKGDENGNFNPTANVKRSEAAKMIYVLKNNGVDDGAVAFQGVSKYADVPVGHWAEGYINYCTNLGYMGGWKEGNVQKFDPNGNVTGVELMKMLLCMVGYKADMQGYTGNGWQTNVLVDAATSGLSVEFNPSVYAATPRQWTARLMVNALNARWVTYSKGELNYENNTYADQFLGLKQYEGILTATKTVALATTAGTVAKGTASTTKSVVGGQNVDFAASEALLGEHVDVYYKEGVTPGVSNAAKVYAVQASGDSTAYNTTLDAIKVDGTKLSFEGYSKDHASLNIKVYTNYVGSGTAAAIGTITQFNSKSVNPVKLVDEDNDGDIDAAYISSKTYAIVKEYNADKKVLKLEDAASVPVEQFLKSDGTVGATSATNLVFNKDNAENWAMLNINGALAKGDVVAITTDYTSGKVKFNIEKLSAVNSKVAGYTVASNGTAYETLKVNGTDYKVSANMVGSYVWTISAGADVATHDTFYTDGKYVVYSKASEEAAPAVTNLAYLIDGAVETDAFNKTTAKVKVLLADGTQGTYVLNDKTGLYKEVGNVDSNTTDAIETADFATFKDKIYTYSIAGGVITLKSITSTASVDANGKLTYVNATGDIKYKPANGIAAIDSNEYKTNSETFFFVKSGSVGSEKYTVVKASELKQEIVDASPSAGQIENKKGASVFAAQKVNGFNTLLAGVMTLDTVPTAKALDYYFVTGTASYVGKVDDKYVVELPVNAAGTESKLTFKYADQGDANTGIAAVNALNGKLVTVALNSDGTVDTASGTQGLTAKTPADLAAAPTPSTWYAGNLTAWDGTNAVIGNQIVKIASNVKIFNVDVSTSNNTAAKLTDGTSVVLSDGSKTSVVVYFNAEKEISVIFCEVDGADITNNASISGIVA